MLGRGVVVEERGVVDAGDENTGAREIGELELEEGVGLMKGIGVLL